MSIRLVTRVIEAIHRFNRNLPSLQSSSSAGRNVDLDMRGSTNGSADVVVLWAYLDSVYASWAHEVTYLNAIHYTFNIDKSHKLVR